MKSFIYLSLLTLALTACSSTSNNTAVSPVPAATGAPTQATNQQAQRRPLVVTTVAPLTNIVSNIAGDRVEVKGIIPEGTDSHTFEPRPSDTDILSKANLILMNGLNLELPTEKLANATKPKETKIFEMGSIPLLSL